MGNKVAIINVNWPDPNEDFLENLETEIAIQINGKLRGTITIDPDLPEDAIKEKAKEEGNVKKYIIGKQIKKIIYIEKKLINLVVTD